jgi:hypothetical protein
MNTEAGAGMNISRRNFLAGVTGCAVTLWSFPPFRSHRPGVHPEPELDCILLDLESRCVLRESLQGYQAALRGEHSLVPETELHSRRGCRMVIVPGLGGMDPAVARTLSDLLEAGTDVLLESGAGFLNPGEFTAHQRMLHRHFDIAVGPPVDLWAGNSVDYALRAHPSGGHASKKGNSHAFDPYVTYLWPRETKVRDFSRVIPVSVGGADVIGKVGTLPVALKKQTAKGALIFLGSPLGPSLRAGDFEALSWLRLVTAL